MDQDGDDCRLLEPEEQDCDVDDLDLYDEDCDADDLNDETFGDHGEEYKWDELFEFGQQDPFYFKTTTTTTTTTITTTTTANTSIIKTLQPNGKDNKSQEVGAVLLELDNSNCDEPSKEKVNKSEDYYDINILHLGESMSRLFLECGDDDKSNKLMLKSKNACFTSQPQHESQMAKKNLTTWCETESCGSSILLEDSIWSAPPASVVQESSNSNYINSHQHLERNNETNMNDNDNIRQTTDIGPPPTPGIMRRLEYNGVEESLISPVETSKKPKILTHQEVERELMKYYQTPVLPSVLNSNDQASSDLVSASGPREMFLLKESTPTPPPPGLTLYPTSTGIPEMTNMNMNISPTFSPHLYQQQQHMNHVIQQQLHQQQQQQDFQKMIPYMVSQPVMPFQHQLPQQHMHHVIQQQQGFPRIMPTPIPGIPQMTMMNMPPSSSLSNQQEQHLHHLIQAQQQHQGFQRTMSMMASPPVMPFQQQQVRGVLPMQIPHYNQNNTMSGYNGYDSRIIRNSQNHSVLSPRPTRSQSLDPYAGLMTQNDKQRLVNIQIMQLQDGHPHHSDYYFLMKKIKVTTTTSLPPDPRSSKYILEKMYPKRGGVESKSTYQPAATAMFGNSLGKLQFSSSALAPRKAIDTVICFQEKASSHKFVNSARYLLLEIERLYETVLILEESDIRLSLLGTGDEEDILRRKKCTDKVLKVLANHDKVDAIMTTNKGKLLITRLISLMGPEEKFKSFNYILGSYKEWSEGEFNNTDIDKCYPYLRQCIFHLNQVSLLECVATLNPKDFVYKKLGLSIILALLYQAEKLLGRFTYGKPCDEFIRRWNSFFTETMEAMLPNLDDLEAPAEIFVNIFIHLERFKVENQDIEMLKSKLKHWSEVNSSEII